VIGKGRQDVLSEDVLPAFSNHSTHITPHASWLATMKNDLSHHNLSVEDATELALDRPLWGLLAASGAMHALKCYALHIKIFQEHQ